MIAQWVDGIQEGENDCLGDVETCVREFTCQCWAGGENQKFSVGFTHVVSWAALQP